MWHRVEVSNDKLNNSWTVFPISGDDVCMGYVALVDLLPLYRIERESEDRGSLRIAYTQRFLSFDFARAKLSPFWPFCSSYVWNCRGG